ncbi:hypothetical protein [Brevundimonas pishanensis]|uniref:hypothetical protein n=1 Tax=Brevundimonas pishanensis TaxID=2896315 RepID=UPI001FA6F76D|nr:hypothetical protein [Brevundimonas pishanensis]
MAVNITDVLQQLGDALDSDAYNPDKDGLSPDDISDMLGWISAANYGASVLLSRLRRAGVDLRHPDGRDLDAWTVEQVKMGNSARNARHMYCQAHGIPLED